MPRLGSLGVVALGLWASACASPAVQGGRSPKVSADVYKALEEGSSTRVIVGLREPDAGATTLSARAEQIAAAQRSVRAELEGPDFRVSHEWRALSGLAGVATSAGLSRLAAHPLVTSVSPDRVGHAMLGQSVPLIRADEVHDLGIGGNGVTVAVLDTGIDPGHPDLADHLLAERCFCSQNGGCCPDGGTKQSGAGSARDDNGHGTHVAGIIASRGRVAPLGVAPDAGLVAVRVMDPTGRVAESDMIAGLDYLLSERPDVKVVNLSLGFTTFSGLCDSASPVGAQAFTRLVARGTAPFAASGNDALSTQIAYPSCVTNAIAVGAVYKADFPGLDWVSCSDSSPRADQVACFSNSNSLVSLLAPGAIIVSSGRGGGTLEEGGTSQATPHAAGVAALLLQANPGLSPIQLVTVMRATGVPVQDRRNGIVLPRIDARAALAAVR